MALLALVVSGPLTQSLGDALGLGSAAVLAWRIAKWPVLLVVAVVIVATLYYATPNVKQTKFRWLSLGALVAIIAWVLLSLAFGLNVANFSSYNKTYGALAGVHHRPREAYVPKQEQASTSARSSDPLP